MAYTTLEKVQAEFKSVTFSSSTAVTDDDVTDFIAQEEAMLNGKIAKKYAVPITATASLPIMELIATLYVKARIEDILEVKTGDDDADQGSGGKAMRDRADALVKDILEDSLTLAGASPAEAGGGVSDYVSQHMVPDETTPRIQRTFRRDSQAW